MVKTIRDVQRAAKRVKIGVPDEKLTGNAGLVAVSEVVDRLGVIEAIDTAVGPIKERSRGFGAGQLVTGIAVAQLAGEDFMVGLDRQRAETVGQLLTPVVGLSSTTAAGLARRMTPGQWAGVETGLSVVSERMLTMLPAPRRAALTSSATVDIDATDVEVYGRKKRGVAYTYEGKRCGRPDVAVWAETETALAADLLSGGEDPRSSVVDLLGRALNALPDSVRAGRVAIRVDAGYFDGKLARTARAEGVSFAIGAKRVPTMWRALSGLGEDDWHDAEGMTGAQVAVADYAPADWPDGTRLIIRRVRQEAGQISADPRSRRRRTLTPEQRVLPLDELAGMTVHAYSFIATDLNVSTPAKAVAVECWYRHRTTVENVFRDGKHGAGLLHLPSGYPEINTVWLWGALLAVNIAGWLHELTGAPVGDRNLAGHGVRGGKAMIETLRRRLIAIPARLVRHARGFTLRCAPGNDILATVLARIRALPAAP